jgi:hypothetical protein
MLRALLTMLRHGVAEKIFIDEAPAPSYGTTDAQDGVTHEQSPEALSARLDAIEAALDDKQAVHRLKVEAALARFSQGPTHEG